MKIDIRKASISRAALSMALATIIFASPATAQNAVGNGEDTEDAKSSQGLGMIIVTAQRKEESLQDAAAGIHHAACGRLPE